VVVDGNLISSRKPDDIPAFSGKMVELFNISQTPLSDVVAEMRDVQHPARLPKRESDVLDMLMQA
jgi:hypothetical protein